MRKKTRTTALAALISAFTVIILYLASIWPTGRLGLVALASIFAAASVVESGIIPGIYVYVVSSVIGILLLPEKSAPLLYILFFGYYPVVKSLAERVRKKPLQLLIKLIVFNAALSVIWIFLGALVFGDLGDLPETALLYIGCNAAFVAFDYGFSKLIWFYIERISKHMKKMQ